MLLQLRAVLMLEWVIEFTDSQNLHHTQKNIYIFSMAYVDFVRAEWHTTRRRPGLNEMLYLYLIILHSFRRVHKK